jgi:HPt (histidine-containing phosphotransfer) domain-containing protein
MNTINIDELLERCMGMHSIMESVLTQFHDLGENMLTNIEKHMDAGCWEELSRAAHSLKGASGSISAAALYATAAQMEAHARNADAEACRELRPTLRREMELCLRDIPMVLQDSRVESASQPEE